MAHSVLDAAERECAQRGGDVDQKYEQHGVACVKTHYLLRIYRRHYNDRLDACLIKHKAGKKAHQVAIAAGMSEGIAEPRD